MSLRERVDLNDLLLFEAVAECGGFSAAAARLGVATAKVSLEVARLERALGMALFHRTTRKVTLTPAGSGLYEECRPLLRAMGEALERAGAGREELVGTLRISTTVDHASQALGPALAEFAALHPQLAIDLRTGDRVVDLLDEGIDLAIRLGWLRDSSLHAVKFGDFRQYLVAAPAYLARAGTPRTPDELAKASWIALSLMPKPLTWTFSADTGEKTTVQVRSRLRVDSPSALRAMLENGAGVSVLDEFNARASLDSGRLVALLQEWSLPAAGIYGVYPSGRLQSARVRGFIDFYRDFLARSLLSPGRAP